MRNSYHFKGRKFLKFLFPVFSSICTLLASSPYSYAHPHVFAEARLDVVLDTHTKTITSLRHVWRFDDFFSSSVVLDFDRNGNKKLDQKELEEVTKIIYNSLKEYEYFQLVSVNNQKITMKPPKSFIADFQDGQLIILFESEPEKPIIVSGKVQIAIHDPSFYTAIIFSHNKDMAINQIPQGCHRQIIEPSSNTLSFQNMIGSWDDSLKNPKPGIASVFRKTLELNCPVKG